VRFLKLARYSPAIQSLFEALYAERRALVGCVVILFGAALFSATAMHMVESRVQPDKLGTIPDAMWWAIVTLATVGYGDVVPVTPLGRIVATVTILVGIIIMALPIGIIANAFAQQVHRRDFVVTWTMVSRVPLFEGLSASEIGDIMKLLMARRVEPGEVIVRRGERAESMFFVVKGEVEIVIDRKKVRFGPGHFFGEVALLQRARRSATSIAVTRCDLLVLQARDLHMLMERDERIGAHIRTVAEARLGRQIAAPTGDMIAAWRTSTQNSPSEHEPFRVALFYHGHRLASQWSERKEGAKDRTLARINSTVGRDDTSSRAALLAEEHCHDNLKAAARDLFRSSVQPQAAVAARHVWKTSCRRTRTVPRETR
jgi:voltage-gated potassium channel